LPAIGCHDDVARDEVVGELDNGTFQYICLDDSDPMCPTGRTALDFPDTVGKDGTFDLDFDPDQGSSSGIRIEAVAEDLILGRTDSFRALASGTTALLAKRTSSDRVIDIVYLAVEEVAGIEIEQDGRSPRLVLEVGDTVTLDATAVDADRSVLAGARDFRWAVSDPQVLRLERANPTAHMDVQALREGSVTITVTTGDISEELNLSTSGQPVLEGGVTPDASGNPEPGPDAATPRDAAPPPSGDPDAATDAGETLGDASSRVSDAGADAADGAP
jgi:hypothetical protein